MNADPEHTVFRQYVLAFGFQHVPPCFHMRRPTRTFHVLHVRVAWERLFHQALIHPFPKVCRPSLFVNGHQHARVVKVNMNPPLVKSP